VKKTFAIILAAALIISVSPKLTAHAESLYIHKVVSVVYDDSVSIYVNGSKNWSYVSYAMQSFCGLLNAQDKLFITYLSDPAKPVQIDLSSNRQAGVDSIRTHTESAGTPYPAIDSAFSLLEGAKDSNKNTQYWLVIITDGVFVKKEKTPASPEVLITQDDLNAKLNGFANKRMPNGSNVKITYLAIGQEVISPDPAKVKNISVYPEPEDGAIVSEEKIVSVMSKISDKVSGRTRLTSKNMTFIDNKTVKIESKIPLVDIAVLSQKSSAKLLNAKIENGTGLNMEQTASVKYPEMEGRATDTSLSGTVSLVSNSGANIEPGSYILSFSEAVDPGSLSIMFEPALEIRMGLYYRNGQEITDVDKLLPGDTIDVAYKIFESGTDKEIRPDMLDASVQYDLSYFEDGLKIKSDTMTDRTLLGIILKEADTKISASIVIPGFDPIVSSVEFQPLNPVIYSIESIGNTEPAIGRRNLYSNKEAVRFAVLADGVRMTKAGLAGAGIKYTTDKHPKLLTVDAVILDDGTVCCAPRFDCWRFPSPGFWNWTSTWLFSCSELKIFAVIGGKEMEAGKVNIVRESFLEMSVNYIVLLIVLFFIYGYIFKSRFKMGSKIYYIEAGNNKETITAPRANWQAKELSALSLRTFIPWVRNRVKISGIVFYAMSGGVVGVLPREVGKESRRLKEKMVNENSAVYIPAGVLKSTFVPEKTAARGRQAMELFTSGEGLLETSDMQTFKIFKYLKPFHKASNEDDD